MKKISRKIIIRNQDLGAFVKKIHQDGLYDSMEIEALTIETIQHENVIGILSGRLRREPYSESPLLDQEMQMRESRMYDPRYMNWKFTYDYPNGQIYVQPSTKNSWPDPLLLITVEKTL